MIEKDKLIIASSVEKTDEDEEEKSNIEKNLYFYQKNEKLCFEKSNDQIPEEEEK